ncbi:MAG: tRNA (adenosine(37)-N6)-threonylcarbamoyltransferase complex ATPase subunit type 1 TsaE [Saprospiraceae bacterium]|nr:tRNA (adenosine(37)-N6)-threonylcarbamoyltransferase complex ATPase subunit type 1 TsaE [Saprospiraceae bacterium]
MSSMELMIQSLLDLDDVALQLLTFAGKRKKIALIGEMGTGKTTLVKKICQQLGVKEPVTSPTFSIINEYSYLDELDKQKIVYHIDLYRLNQVEEAINIGIEEYLYNEHYCFIEWPQLIASLLPLETVQVMLKLEDHSHRKVVFL